MTQARVGVVVLTCRRPEAVLRTLDKLAALPEQPPIAVVDNGTGDGTAARIARLFPQVELVTAPGNLGAAARNLGVLRLMTPYIAFCNDDTWWSPGSLARAAQLLDSFPRVGVLSPRLLIGPEQRQDEACLAMAQRPLPSLGLPGLAVMGFSAGACVFRRQAFLEAGGYEPHLFLGEEEALLALDLATHGWAMVYDPDLIAHRYPTPPDDSTERQLLLTRNAVWTAWLRRPLLAALRETQAAFQRCAPGIKVRCVAAILSGLPWVLSRRRVVPPKVEMQLARLSRRSPPFNH